MKVLVFGSLNIDYVYQVDHIVCPGETETTTSYSVNCGGKGLNQSIALARAGADVWHAGLVGQEGDELINKCVENGVHTDYVRTISGSSGHTIIQVDKDGNNSILLFGGANQCMTNEFIDEVLSGFSSGDIILLQNEINLLDVIIDKAYDNGLQIVLNPSPYNETLAKCNLSKVSYFILNEIEGEQMTGMKEPLDIVNEIYTLYPSSKIVLTLGDKGSMYFDGVEVSKQEAFKVKAVDTTAAGDTFTGYFIASLICGLEIKNDIIDHIVKNPNEALKIASMASALAVTKAGALDSIPLKKEVLNSLQHIEGKNTL